ncbi:MAG: hypothetical protein OEV73_00185 [Desulfobulbaceae bacterium]|nr:hypothetical protein [Desulfobulbaceae bacterium]
MDLKSFEQAFGDGLGSSTGQCACGAVFYNPDGGWDWEDGELEGYRGMADAVELDYAVGFLSFEGAQYVLDCECWHSRAEKIMKFLDSHAHKIVDYMHLEKERAVAEAAAMPTV